MDGCIKLDALLSAAKDYNWISGLKTVLKRIPIADVRPVVMGAPLIEINEPWQPMRGDKDRFYYTKRYLCRNCEYQIKTESWEKDRCFGAGTIFKENSMPNFCPNCGADLRA